MDIEANSRLLADFSRLFSRLIEHVGRNCECEVDEFRRDRNIDVIEVMQRSAEWLIEGHREPEDIAYSIRARLAGLAGPPRTSEVELGDEVGRYLDTILERKREREASLAKRCGENHG